MIVALIIYWIYLIYSKIKSKKPTVFFISEMKPVQTAIMLIAIALSIHTLITTILCFLTK